MQPPPALFTVASAACGLAPSPTTLVLARVAQGVAGAVVMPQVLLGAFLQRQRRLAEQGGDPLLDLGLFSERGFSAGPAAQLFLAGAQASFFVFLALYLQIVRGLGRRKPFPRWARPAR